MPSTTFRVLAVDDDFRVRAAYDELFRDNTEFTLVGLAQDGQEAIEAYVDVISGS